MTSSINPGPVIDSLIEGLIRSGASIEAIRRELVAAALELPLETVPGGYKALDAMLLGALKEVETFPGVGRLTATGQLEKRG